MAITIVKAVKEFEFENRKVKLGEELVVGNRDSEQLLKEKKVVVGRILDRNDPKDQKAIEKFKEGKEEKHAELGEKAKAREVLKNKREAENDKEAKKTAKATAPATPPATKGKNKSA